MSYPENMDWAGYDRRYGGSALESRNPDWHLSTEGRAMVEAFRAAAAADDDDGMDRAITGMETLREVWGFEGQPSTGDDSLIDAWWEMLPFVEDVCAAALAEDAAHYADARRWAA